jgi:hypothetical protein
LRGWRKWVLLLLLLPQTRLRVKRRNRDALWRLRSHWPRLGRISCRVVWRRRPTCRRASSAAATAVPGGSGCCCCCCCRRLACGSRGGTGTRCGGCGCCCCCSTYGGQQTPTSAYDTRPPPSLPPVQPVSQNLAGEVGPRAPPARRWLLMLLMSANSLFAVSIDMPQKSGTTLPREYKQAQVRHADIFSFARMRRHCPHGLHPPRSISARACDPEEARDRNGSTNSARCW